MFIQFLEVLKSPLETKFLSAVDWSDVPRQGEDVDVELVAYVVDSVRWEHLQGGGKAYVYLRKKHPRRRG
jgi:hypothetical protein